MNKVIWIALLAAPLLATSVHAQQTKQKIQCWNDKNGQRMCGDRVPPEYAGQQREVIQDGRVVETKRGAKTPEEIAEEERQKVAAEEAKRREEYDRALLETYRNTKDIEVMRDERLAMLDGRIRGAEKSSAETGKTLEDLRARAAAAQKKAAEGAAPDAAADEKLARQIRQYERSLADSQKSLERLKAERQQTEKKFTQDMQRYNELRPPKAAEAAP